MPQIKDIAITKTVAADSDWLVMQTPLGETYKIKKSDLLVGLSSGTTQPATNLLTFSSSGDINGIAYYLGRNKNTATWTNPHTSGAVVCVISGGGNGSQGLLVDRQTQGNYTSNVANSWVSVDLKTVKLKPNHYTFRHDANSGYYARSWKLQGSNDNVAWTDLDTQTSNTQIQNPYDWASIPVSGITTAYQYLRILMTATNSSGTNEFCVCEFEFYGEVV